MRVSLFAAAAISSALFHVLRVDVTCMHIFIYMWLVGPRRVAGAVDASHMFVQRTSPHTFAEIEKRRLIRRLIKV